MAKNELSLIKKIQTPELTTSMLIGLFSDYAQTRKKINSLVKKQILIPIKQGVFLASEDLGLRPYSKEILANLIYGPSYISLETALSQYGFIPERIVDTTSVCLGRKKSFSTVVGNFQYHHIKESIYPLDVHMKEVAHNTFCQYAGPEKALLDFLYLKETKGSFRHSREYFEYLIDSYRFDLSAIQKKISLRKIQNLANHYNAQNVEWFASELIRRLKK